MSIETARPVARPFRAENADVLYRIKADPQVMVMIIAVSADTGPAAP